MKNTIAEKIRLIRESRGYSQEFIATKLHVTQQAYSKMEKEPERMSLKRLSELCDVFGVKISHLIEEDKSDFLISNEPFFNFLNSFKPNY